MGAAVGVGGQMVGDSTHLEFLGKNLRETRNSATILSMAERNPDPVLRYPPLLYPLPRWHGREVPMPEWHGPPLQPSAPWFCIDSCFAERCAKALKQHLLLVDFAAAGALYTPEAIFRWLELCTHARNNFLDFCCHAEPLIFEEQGRCFHPHSPGWLEADSREKLLQSLWQQCTTDYKALLRSEVVLLTFGSSFSFYSPTQDCYWSNGHRLSKILEKCLCTENDSTIQACLKLISEHNPEARVLCSVSPLRHEPLAAIDNSLSKAQRLSSVHRLRRQKMLYYLPAYEIVMDELRDYRWYDFQLKQLRIDSFALILQRLLAAAASPELLDFLQQVTCLARTLRHRNKTSVCRPGPADSNRHSRGENSERNPHAEVLLARLQQKYPGQNLPASPQAYTDILQDYQLEMEYY